MSRAGRNPPPANIDWRSDRHVIPPDASHAAESAIPLEQDSITRAWPLESRVGGWRTGIDKSRQNIKSAQAVCEHLVQHHHHHRGFAMASQ